VGKNEQKLKKWIGGAEVEKVGMKGRRLKSG
jgi:hypothetical protein